MSGRSKIKTRLETAYGEWVERIPAWIKWATQVRALPNRQMICQNMRGHVELPHLSGSTSQ